MLRSMKASVVAAMSSRVAASQKMKAGSLTIGSRRWSRPHRLGTANPEAASVRLLSDGLNMQIRLASPGSRPRRIAQWDPPPTRTDSFPQPPANRVPVSARPWPRAKMSTASRVSRSRNSKRTRSDSVGHWSSSKGRGGCPERRSCERVSGLLLKESRENADNVQSPLLTT